MAFGHGWPHEANPLPADAVLVEAPARLHFGMLDLSGTLGRRYGGIGAGVAGPSLLLSASPGSPSSMPRLAATADVGPDGAPVCSEGVLQAAVAAAQRVMAHYDIDEPVRLRVHRAFPPHHGLGSGTQIALAAAQAVVELLELPANPVTLVGLVGRARRSAIGTHLFQHGGLIVEGGRRDDVDRPAPLLARVAMPDDWRCVVVLPPGPPGVSGSAEAAAFAALPPPPAADAERVAHLVLLGLLPAAIDAEFPAFGAALTAIQEINGRWFAAAQGGPFAAGVSADVARALREWGAVGVGQSSWGPAVYALAPDPDRAASLARRIRAAFPASPVYASPFWNTGARVSTRLAGRP